MRNPKSIIAFLAVPVIAALTLICGHIASGKSNLAPPHNAGYQHETDAADGR